MRVSDKARVRQRRIVHGVLILISFSLMFIGKADLAALRNLRMGSNDFLAPIVDVVSAPIRGIETMIEGVRTVASLRAENVRLQGENDLLKRWRRRAEILESENRQFQQNKCQTKSCRQKLKRQLRLKIGLFEIRPLILHLRFPDEFSPSRSRVELSIGIGV